MSSRRYEEQPFQQGAEGGQSAEFNSCAAGSENDGAASSASSDSALIRLSQATSPHNPARSDIGEFPRLRQFSGSGSPVAQIGFQDVSAVQSPRGPISSQILPRQQFPPQSPEGRLRAQFLQAAAAAPPPPPPVFLNPNFQQQRAVLEPMPGFSQDQVPLSLIQLLQIHEHRCPESQDFNIAASFPQQPASDFSYGRYPPNVDVMQYNSQTQSQIPSSQSDMAAYNPQTQSPFPAQPQLHAQSLVPAQPQLHAQSLVHVQPQSLVQAQSRPPLHAQSLVQVQPQAPSLVQVQPHLQIHSQNQMKPQNHHLQSQLQLSMESSQNELQQLESQPKNVSLQPRRELPSSEWLSSKSPKTKVVGRDGNTYLATDLVSLAKSQDTLDASTSAASYQSSPRPENYERRAEKEYGMPNDLVPQLGVGVREQCRNDAEAKPENSEGSSRHLGYDLTLKPSSALEKFPSIDSVDSQNTKHRAMTSDTQSSNDEDLDKLKLEEKYNNYEASSLFPVIYTTGSSKSCTWGSISSPQKGSWPSKIPCIPKECYRETGDLNLDGSRPINSSRVSRTTKSQPPSAECPSPLDSIPIETLSRAMRPLSLFNIEQTLEGVPLRHPFLIPHPKLGLQYVFKDTYNEFHTAPSVAIDCLCCAIPTIAIHRLIVLPNEYDNVTFEEITYPSVNYLPRCIKINWHYIFWIKPEGSPPYPYFTHITKFALVFGFFVEELQSVDNATLRHNFNENPSNLKKLWDEYILVNWGRFRENP